MVSGNSILIIDDEPKLRYSLSMILVKAGFSVTEANGAQEALDALHKKPFDLVFLDLNMPGMGGMQLLPEILHLYPGIPVIILTGNGSLETAEKAINWGVRGYLLKPMSPFEIIDRVSKVIKEERLLKKKGKIYEELKGLLYEMQPDV
jgi:DNA-binding NtrC family response regulator